jgi:hypothetical protein
MGLFSIGASGRPVRRPKADGLTVRSASKGDADERGKYSKCAGKTIGGGRCDVDWTGNGIGPIGRGENACVGDATGDTEAT